MPPRFNTGGASVNGILNADLANVTLVTSGASGTFADANVGTSKTITITGLTLSGSAAANYTVTQPTVTANITQRTLTITGVTANNKVYDGTTTATLNTSGAVVSGILASDLHNVSITSGSGTFEDANANTGIAVDGVLVLGGSAAGNYSVPDLDLTANITPAALTASGINADKTYDGTSTTATLNFTGRHPQRRDRR